MQEKFHKQVYGVSISSSKSNFASSIIENPEMLKIQQRHVMKQQTLANTNKPPAPPPPLIPSGTPTKQDSSTMNGRCFMSTPSSAKTMQLRLQNSHFYLIRAVFKRNIWSKCRNGKEVWRVRLVPFACEDYAYGVLCLPNMEGKTTAL